MSAHCHRCHLDLPAAAGESTFCPHCGAPQLRVVEKNIAGAIPDLAASAEGPSQTHIVWASAVLYAAAVALIAAALVTGVLWLPAAFPLAWLWTICGAVIVLGIYQRRHPALRVDARIGARIGLLYGLFAVAALALATAAAGLIARFGLHTLGTLDTLLINAMHQAAEQQAAQSPSLAMSPDQLHVFYSPEVRAGLALFLLLTLAVFLTGFSALGGAIGGHLRARRR